MRPGLGGLVLPACVATTNVDGQLQVACVQFSSVASAPGGRGDGVVGGWKRVCVGRGVAGSMRGMDAVVDARALVAERFPGARWALLSRAVLGPRRTATSDLDIVVMLEGPPAPYRESLRWRGWPVEVFVHDEASLRWYFDADLAARRPSLARMCAESVVLADRDGTAGDVRAEAAERVAAGPGPLPPAELAARRYGLADLLDDLTGATDPGERAVIGWATACAAAELFLGLGGHWQGKSKWLLRELRAADPDFADRLLAALPDPAAV